MYNRLYFITLMKYVILSCSLSQKSFGSQIGEYIEQNYSNFELINLEECELGLCNGFESVSFDHPKLVQIQQTLEKASGIIIIAPIYNFDVSASCKNLLDLLSKPYKDILTGKSLYHKTIAFIGTCFSHNCYLAPLNFLAKVMITHEAFILPKYAMISKDDGEFKYKKCVDKTVQNFFNMTTALEKFDIFEKVPFCDN